MATPLGQINIKMTCSPIISLTVSALNGFHEPKKTQQIKRWPYDKKSTLKRSYSLDDLKQNRTRSKQPFLKVIRTPQCSTDAFWLTHHLHLSKRNGSTREKHACDLQPLKTKAKRFWKKNEWKEARAFCSPVDYDKKRGRSETSPLERASWSSLALIFPLRSLSTLNVQHYFTSRTR